MNTLDLFADLFAGRTDAHGTWTGGKADGYPDYQQHLQNGPHIGVYCVTDQNLCYWGCVDLDGKDFAHHDNPWDAMWDTANQLCEALDYKNCKGWTERTTNGIHIWVFADEPVPAATMRRALLAACQVIDYRPKEVNPKQETLNPDKPFGNYVRLPYYGAMITQPADRFVIDEDGPMDLETFVHSADGSRTDVSTLESMAACYTPPVDRTVDVVTRSGNIENLYPILPPVVKAIYDDGPLNGDRSSAMVKACLIMREDGWDPQGVYWVIDAIDARLGKFVGREDREAQLLTLVQDYGTK